MKAKGNKKEANLSNLLGLKVPTNASNSELLEVQKELFGKMNELLKSVFTDEQKEQIYKAKTKEAKERKAKEEETKKALGSLQKENLKVNISFVRIIEGKKGKTIEVPVCSFSEILQNVKGKFVKKTVALDIQNEDGEKSKSTNQHAEFKIWNAIAPDETKTVSGSEVGIDLTVRCAKGGLLGSRVIPSQYAKYLQEQIEEGRAQSFSTKHERNSAKQKKHNIADALQSKEVSK